MKRCNQCGKVKPLEDFYSNGAGAFKKPFGIFKDTYEGLFFSFGSA